MTSIRRAALACMTAAMVTLPLAASAQSGMVNQDTYFTFSQQVELPNVTLPAGTYLFRLADTPGNRHIVRVMSQDRQKLFTTLMAIPAYSLDRPPDKPEVRFLESPATKANAIKIWFYPGNPVGHEFIYPRNQAVKLAKASGESVLTTRSDKDVSSSVAENDLTRVNPQGADVDADMSHQRASENARSERGSMQAETVTQSASAQSSATSQQPNTPPPAASATTRQTATPGATGTSGTATTAARTRRSLPRTAGVLPLIGLIGLGSLAGSRIVRRARKA